MYVIYNSAQQLYFCIMEWKVENECNLGILSQVMNKLLKPGTYLTEDHVTKLVKYITGLTDPLNKEIFDNVLQLWLTEAIELSEIATSISSPVLTLAVNVTVYLSSKEGNFKYLLGKNLIHRLIKVLKEAMRNLKAAPNVGYVKLLKAALNHKEGCHWMLTSSYWLEIIDLALIMENNVEVAKECRMFIVQLLEGSMATNLDFFSTIVFRLISPILTFSQTMQKRKLFDEQLFLDQHSGRVRLLGELLELVMTTKISISSDLWKEIIGKYDFLEKCLYISLRVTNLDGYYEICILITFLVTLDVIFKTKEGTIITDEENSSVMNTMINVLRNFNYKQGFFVFPKVLHKLVKLHSEMWLILPHIELNDKIRIFSDQVVYEQLCPVIYSSIAFFGEEQTLEGGDELRVSTIEKHYKRVLPSSFYYMYGVQKYLRENFSFQNVLPTLEYILLTRKYYDRNQANIVLSICIYNYEDICELVSLKDVTPTSHPFIMEYLANLMEIIATFIMEHDLNWQDILETLTLMEITLTVLSSPKSTNCVIVNGLNLIRIVVRKKLSVSMALLTDQIDGDMEKLLSFCAEKLDNENWEIENAAIQVVELVVSSNISRDSAVFQSMILNKQLPKKITRIAIQHENYILRASALKCLQEMVKLNEFWIHVLTEANICEIACQILTDGSQKSIHKEAAKLISVIYKNNYNLRNPVLCKFYDVMSYIFIEDFDSDTKINALEFWRFVVHRLLKDQGWIDGKFPDVTFSTDTKKIVTMSDAEIRKRLIKILFQLSENGCLFALKSALEDKNNEFFNTVKIYWKKMSDVLNKYNVDSSSLKYIGDLHNKYSNYDYHYNFFGGNKMQRQTIHPKVFLESMELFSDNFQNMENSDPNSDIISVFREILDEQFS